MKTLVIGACNIDIVGSANTEMLLHESNIGSVNIALGGVAKNIATNLLNLGTDIAFITLIGDDYFSDLQLEELKSMGIDFNKSFFKKDKSSVYLAIHENNGDLRLAVNDMKPFEALSVNEFKPLEEYINSFDVIIFDTNLNQEVLEYLITKYKEKQIFVDGVSQTKVSRIRNVLKYIDLLKINQYELNSLLNKDNYDIILGVKELIKFGLKTCLISSANEPITYNIGDNIYQSVTQKIKDIKSSSGAGDALFSGTVYYLLNGKTMHEAVNFGKIIASKTLEVYESCNKNIKELIDL